MLGGSVTLENSILWNVQDTAGEISVRPAGSIVIRNSIVRGGYVGAINSDPLFEGVTTARHLWMRLRNDSPAINRGAVISVGKRDHTGELRVGLPDLGPTENRPTDTDADGLADDWEVWHFGDLSAEATTDAEPGGDGLTNLQEFLNLTDPLSSDSDRDALPDGYEIEHGLLPSDASDYLSDKDRDGIPNVYEYANGTSPSDSASVPAPHAIVSPGAGAIQGAIDALPTVATAPQAWNIIRINPGDYEEALDLSQRRILLQGGSSRAPVTLQRPASAGYNVLITQPGCALDGLIVVGAERLADPNNTTAEQRAGGIIASFTIPNSAFRITNCILRRHVRSALSIAKGSVVVSHCSFLNNFPALEENAYAGSVILCVNSKVDLQGSILWNPVVGESRLKDSRANWLRGGRSEIGLTNSIVVASTDSIVRFGGHGGANRDAGLTREGLIIPASPAIDRASVAKAPLLDLHGELRDASPDAGADEFIDTDSDHLPDAWELRWFGDLSRSFLDDSEPSGGDGVSNYGEFVAGTNPNSDDSDGNGISDLVDITASVNEDPSGIGFRTDSDGDGLSDGYEIITGTNPFNDGISDFNVWIAGSPISDDGDGLSFAQEMLIGTNPYLADTDGDGVNDRLDFFPHDPTRSAALTPDPNDSTPPEIFLDVPENAIPVP